ncbi:unnamed protein product, partial [Discosporangium mesarthrocarpum]
MGMAHVPDSLSILQVVSPINVKDCLPQGGSVAEGVLWRSLTMRTALREAILSGDLKQASKMIQDKCPSLLHKREDLRFALKCQELIELIKKGELTAVLNLAQTELQAFREASGSSEG